MPARYDEYLYVSDAKLRQFVPNDDRWWRRLRVRRAAGKVAVPEVGEVSVDVEVRDPRLLARVEAEVGAGARWFEEPVTPGEWVLFEGRVVIQVFDSGPAEGAVVLVQVAARWGATRRVVMHGSAAHLVGRQSGGTGATPQLPPAASSPADVPTILTAAALDGHAPVRGAWQRFVTGLHRGQTLATDHIAQLATVLERFDTSPLLRGSAFSVAAAARVSTVLADPSGRGDVLVASPLFVRHAPPDDRTDGG